MPDVFINEPVYLVLDIHYTRIKKRSEDAVLLVSFPKLTLCLVFERTFERF